LSDVQQYQLEPANADTVAHFKRQWHQVLSGVDKVTCECNRTLALACMFRCLYCGCFFCQTCAEVHFGETRKAYAARRAAEIEGDRKAALRESVDSLTEIVRFEPESGQL
jgi:hypothetical protein